MKASSLTVFHSCFGRKFQLPPTKCDSYFRRESLNFISLFLAELRVGLSYKWLVCQKEQKKKLDLVHETFIDGSAALT